MENFITGFPGCEFQVREALAEVLGQDRAAFFFDKFLEYFFTEADAIFFKSLGLNCIRIAVNYRHFEDDLNPRTLKADGFKHLDRVVSLCAKYGIYTVIDMHTARELQSLRWHCDSGTHIANFWVHKDFQDRLIWLWKEIAVHYRDNPFYDRVCAAIRAVDSAHIFFLDGNTFATDFSKFPQDVKTRWGENVAYAIHDYSVYGFPKSKEKYEGTEEQKANMKATYLRKRKWMDDRELCVWNGEWGPVYARYDFDGEETDDINRRRYAVLKDQLEIYRPDKLSWSIWLYKDIGFQGMVHVSESTPYMKLFKPFILKKYRLAVDAWGASDRAVRHIYEPIVQLVKESSDAKLYPPIWSVDERVTRLSRTILLAEFLVKEWAEMFQGMNEATLDELAKSFLFENCLKRDGLNEILTAHAAEVI
ncbi:glycoside hydrolase family 5 protein [Mycena floridula]|nr:glycoside hydrolase family 5 protein [Mycena floridula]